ncbi:MAG TPA: cation:proton antiporter [Euzebya sp.]|nr:cation:proton antiporter [Euzebya sp.]
MGHVLAASANEETAFIFVELGAIFVVLAVVARFARWREFSPIPLYLLAGLAFGTGGAAPLRLSEGFVTIGAEIGVLLLLFMLGLEYSGDELRDSLRANLPSGLVDLALNFPPGLIAGLALGWDPVGAVLMGGVTYISSSGIIAKVLEDMERLGNRETPSILSILVLEDLAMAVYLPLVGVLLIGADMMAGVLSLGLAITAAMVALVLAVRYGRHMSRVIASSSDEVVVLSVFGLVLLIGGLAEQMQVSSAVGAFLVGIALSGRVAEQARVLLGPLRDLFAAVFFVFFGLQIDPSGIPSVAVVALGLGLITATTKVATGWYAARRSGVQTRGRFRAGATLIARGEFSIVIAGIGVAAGVQPGLGALAAAYVLLMAILGPVAARVVDPIVGTLLDRRAQASAVEGRPA